MTTDKQRSNSHLMQIMAHNADEKHDIEKFLKLESLGVQPTEKLDAEMKNIKHYAS